MTDLGREAVIATMRRIGFTLARRNLRRMTRVTLGLDRLFVTCEAWA